jgi:hypothetical protein
MKLQKYNLSRNLEIQEFKKAIIQTQPLLFPMPCICLIPNARRPPNAPEFGLHKVVHKLPLESGPTSKSSP